MRHFIARCSVFKLNKNDFMINLNNQIKQQKERMSFRTLRSEQTVYVVSSINGENTKVLKAFQNKYDERVARSRACCFAVQQMIQDLDSLFLKKQIDTIKYNRREMMTIRQIEIDTQGKNGPLTIFDWDLVRHASINEHDFIKAYEFMFKFINAIKHELSVSVPVCNVERVSLVV